ncbi:MAG: hypothetical protein JRI23_32095 [Deltaproteobacteria bacterium]|nr:hypothetical protein [Deltaproteobacteria bacterium]MBW2536875.1 hypothetical protein [Deltaproteobacteria bacterium]
MRAPILTAGLVWALSASAGCGSDTAGGSATTSATGATAGHGGAAGAAGSGGTAGSGGAAGSGGSTGGAGTVGTMTVAEWASEFDAYWDDPAYDYSMEATHMVGGSYRGARMAAESGNYDQEYYFLSYQLNGLLQIWQATGQDKYLRDALELIHICIAQAVDVGGGYLGWPNADNDGYPLWDSICWRIVTSLLRVMHESPTLLTQPNATGGTYQDDYDEILAFTETHIWNRYAGTATAGITSGNLYRSRTHMASHWARIANDLHVITGTGKYLEVFDNISFAGFPAGTSYPGDSMRNQLRISSVDPDAWEWNQTWDVASGGGGTIQDMSHANQVVSWLSNAYETGYYWTKDDVDKLTATLDQVLLTGSNYQLWYNLDQTVPASYPSGLFEQRGRGHEWMVLGRYDQALQDKIETNYVHGGTNGEYNLRYYATSVLGVMALNQKLLTDRAPVYPE